MANNGEIPRIGTQDPPVHDTALTSNLSELLQFVEDHKIPREAGMYAYRTLPGGRREEWAIREIRVELTSLEPGMSAIYFELIDELAPFDSTP